MVRGLREHLLRVDPDLGSSDDLDKRCVTLVLKLELLKSYPTRVLLGKWSRICSTTAVTRSSWEKTIQKAFSSLLCPLAHSHHALSPRWMWERGRRMRQTLSNRRHNKLMSRIEKSAPQPQSGSRTHCLIRMILIKFCLLVQSQRFYTMQEKALWYWTLIYFAKKLSGVGCLRALNKQMSLLNVCKLSFRTTSCFSLTQLPAVINLVTHSLQECKKRKWKQLCSNVGLQPTRQTSSGIN